MPTEKPTVSHPGIPLIVCFPPCDFDFFKDFSFEEMKKEKIKFYIYNVKRKTDYKNIKNDILL